MEITQSAGYCPDKLGEKPVKPRDPKIHSGGGKCCASNVLVTIHERAPGDYEDD